jgi:hypothetical protein
MRVNVYGEELTDRVELVEKSVDEGGEVYTFYGVRFWLKFPNQEWWIHRKVDGIEDDDSSAITIWATSKEKLAEMFTTALASLGSVVTEERIQQVRAGYQEEL